MKKMLKFYNQIKQTQIDGNTLLYILGFEAIILIFMAIFWETPVNFTHYARGGGLDFQPFYNTAKLKLAGEDIYHIGTLDYIAPPLGILHSLLLSVFSFRTASNIFFITNILLLIFSCLYIRAKGFNFKGFVGGVLFFLSSLGVCFLLDRGNTDGIVLFLIVIAIFCPNNFFAALAFSAACFYKIYPIVLIPLLFRHRGYNFIYDFLFFSILVFIIFFHDFSQYGQILLQRVTKFAAFDENITPCGLIRTINEFYPINIHSFVKIWHYIWFIVAGLGVFFDLYIYKYIKEDKFKVNYLLSTYTILMISMPEVVYMYSSVVLLLPLFGTLAKIDREKKVTLLDLTIIVSIVLMSINYLAFENILAPETSHRIYSIILPAQIGGVILFISCFILTRISLLKEYVRLKRK